MIPLVLASLALTCIPAVYSADATAQLPSIWMTVNTIGPQVEFSTRMARFLTIIAYNYEKLVSRTGIETIASSGGDRRRI